MLVNPGQVVVDGFNLAMPKGTGIATYARALTRCLRLMGADISILYGLDIPSGASADLREILFFDRLASEISSPRVKALSPRWWRERVANLSGCSAVEVPLSGRVDYRSFADRLPVYDRLYNARMLFTRAARHFRQTGKLLPVELPSTPRIVHWTYPIPAHVPGAKNVYAIHDVVPLNLPHTTLDNKTYHHRLLRKIITQADAICTVSESSARDIAAFYPEAASRLFNTYQSVEPDPLVSLESELEVAARVKNLFGLEKDSYFLFFGSLEPKKNLGRLINAFLASTSRRPLVIVGAMAWKSESELRFINQGVKAGRIIQLDYLPRSMLDRLTRCARAVLFPSLSEGFGLPVLEAMLAGTAVLSSREGALPEVVGEAGSYVDAYDEASITAGIEALDQDDDLVKRLLTLAPVQAEKFSMQNYGRRLGAMYQALCS